MKAAKSTVSKTKVLFRFWGSSYIYNYFMLFYHLIFLFFFYVLFDFDTYRYTLTVVEGEFSSDTALGAKRHQDKIPYEKLQKHQGAHQQHQKTSQVSKAQLNSKTTLKGTSCNIRI